MDELKTAEQIKEFILNYRADSEDEFVGISGPCYSLSWKKDFWLIRENNKKVGVIDAKMVPRNFDLRGATFLKDCLAILRKSNVDGLTKWLRALKRGQVELA